MTKILQLLFITIAFAFAAAPAISLAADPIVVAESITAKATIVKVNKKTRELTLRDEQGHEETVVASKDVRNFNQIKKGDVLEVEYHHAAASALEKVDDTTDGRREHRRQTRKGRRKAGHDGGAHKNDHCYRDRCRHAKSPAQLKGPEGQGCDRRGTG